ncbi:MAG: endonuclease/exonuclease/phosphatase family protein [Ruminococcus sp.]|nr:endonuclease/exonuclease/phosphatase family protein [Ruminococcus sp.]
MTELTNWLPKTVEELDIDVILGDFNAGDYTKPDRNFAESRETFRVMVDKLSPYYVNMCNLPTRIDPKTATKSCIDHVFVKTELATSVSNLIVHYEVEYSDHYPITFSIEIPDKSDSNTL